MPIQKIDRDTTWNVTRNNKTWTLAEDAKITVADQPGIADNAHDNSTIKVLGDITAKGTDGDGVFVTGEKTSVLVGDHSRINADKGEHGIHAESTLVDITNRGTVSGYYSGIYGTSDSTLRNFGAVSGDYAVYFGGSEDRVINHGDIIGNSQGVAIESGGYVRNEAGAKITGEVTGVALIGSGLAEVTNRGLIRGGDAAILNGGDDIHIRNTGKIVGDILMGEGEDRFDTRGGIFKGEVHGGDGDDRYFVSKPGVRIVEENGFSGGIDRVSSTVGHKLADSVEELYLLGTRNVDGAGNTTGNMMFGNKGDNNLFGLEGNDYLNGRGGNDKLTGGDDVDTFEFTGKFGQDRVMDFNDGEDHLIISGVTSQQDVDALDMTEKNGKLIIDMGNGNTITIDDMTIAQLSYAQDFAT